jgi:molybdate transport system substrate-binding protein
MSVSRCFLAIVVALLGWGAVPSAVFAAEAATATRKGASVPAPEIIVYAAASLKDALTALVPLCESAAGVHLVFNFGASNDLARQIVAAGKADVFFSAEEGWMDQVAREGLVDLQSRRTLLSNRLAVVVPEESNLKIASAADLAGTTVRKIAFANPEAVPAGRYAKAWLTKAGVWEKLQEKIVPYPDVRATLAGVEAGAVDAGVVYRTDAAVVHHTKVAFEVPEEEGPRIAYPLAALKDRPQAESTRRTIACLSGETARPVYERFGFVFLEPSP